MVRFVSGSDLLVPEGSHVVHIGPSKTGTTSLQSAFHICREQMSEQGVHVVGQARHPWVGVRAFLGMDSTRHNDAPPSMEKWDELVAETKSVASPRTVISSEFLAHAKVRDIRTLVDQLGADHIQVVVTLRPVAKILPSLWQQRVQAGVTRTLDEWLEDAFKEPDGPSALWWRHRHDKLIARWSRIVGTDRVTAVVVDDSDHDSVLRSFEQILGLRGETLVADSALSNRSLTLGEAEMIRTLNVALQDTEMSGATRARLVGRGAARHLKDRKPGPDEPRVLMPRWAIDRATEVSNTIIEGILPQEIKVTGDLELLRRLPPSRESAGQPDQATVPAEVASRLAMGLILTAELASESAAATLARKGKKKKQHRDNTSPNTARTAVSQPTVPATPKARWQRLVSAAARRISGTIRPSDTQPTKGR